MSNIQRISTLLCINLLAFGCDVDDGQLDLDDPAAIDDERDEPIEDERDDLAAIEGGRDEPHADPDDLHLATDQGRHCVVEATVVPEGVDPTTVRAAAPEMRCFPTFAQAIFSVTGERLAADATPDTYEPATVLTSEAPDPQRASYVAGIEYQYDNYGGKSLAIHASSTCLTAGSIFLNKFSDSWWDNRITSAKAYSGCKHSYHYENSYQSGAVKDCGTACWYVGAALQNRTSSLRWTK